MTVTSEPLLSAGLESQFEDITVLSLITLDEDMPKTFISGGKRNDPHIKHVERESFLPRLIVEVEDSCRREDGCF